VLNSAVELVSIQSFAGPSLRSYLLGVTPCPAGNKERYGGTEFALTDLVEKSKVDIVVVR
jgi:hypothetical protein